MTLLTLLISACSYVAETNNTMRLKGNFVFNDNAENASYCILQYFDTTYNSFPSSVDQIDNGWKIQLKRDKQLIFILVMVNAANQKTLGELFLEEGGYSNQAWLERVSKAALSCKGHLTY